MSCGLIRTNGFHPFPQGKLSWSRRDTCRTQGLSESAWSEQEIQFLVGCQLELPQTPHQEISRQEHTPYLKVMLADLQSVARLDSQAHW